MLVVSHKRNIVLAYTQDRWDAYVIGATFMLYGLVYRITDRRMRFDLRSGQYLYFEIECISV